MKLNKINQKMQIIASIKCNNTLMINKQQKKYNYILINIQNNYYKIKSNKCYHNNKIKNNQNN